MQQCMVHKYTHRIMFTVRYAVLMVNTIDFLHGESNTRLFRVQCVSEQLNCYKDVHTHLPAIVLEHHFRALFEREFESTV